MDNLKKAELAPIGTWLLKAILTIRLTADLVQQTASDSGASPQWKENYLIRANDCRQVAKALPDIEFQGYFGIDQSMFPLIAKRLNQIANQLEATTKLEDLGMTPLTNTCIHHVDNALQNVAGAVVRVIDPTAKSIDGAGLAGFYANSLSS
jgi:hypothetical protein